MKTTVLLSGLVLVVASVSTVAESEFNKKSAVEEAKVITKSFGGALQKELKAAMQTGGPIKALEVCNVKAIPITDKISEDKQAQVSRVSLKNRNPNNVPNEWQRTVLEDFDKRAANGEDIQTMASVKVVDKGDGKQLHFMKALPTGGVCLACHGETVSKEVNAKLNTLYPDDKATGYTLGQVRGAIIVVKDYK